MGMRNIKQTEHGIGKENSMEHETIKSKEQYIKEISQKTVELRLLCEEVLVHYKESEAELKQQINTAVVLAEFERLCKKHDVIPDDALDALIKELP